ncbi:hypothetical protein F1654_11315 [Alkalicaulis satelles]|uniref:Uncharacterized protein n=1 Tax=Alkalicaulis satelles TaxID=2609175 RepID=A0A5M6ZCE2_9PROT|nr:hypothetical protein [Alkalicaulis satelles]KAA5802403.1 hypothetical protein F1654_11315 [Alkalicaulis satelles]
MALVKVILVSGSTVEVETTAIQADDLVAAFARFVAEKRVPEKRTILTPNQSIYIDFSKVAVIRREF